MSTNEPRTAVERAFRRSFPFGANNHLRAAFEEGWIAHERSAEAAPIDAERAVKILIDHQRRDAESCICAPVENVADDRQPTHRPMSERSFPGKQHVVAPPSDPRPQAPIPSPGHERSAGAAPLDVGDDPSPIEVIERREPTPVPSTPTGRYVLEHWEDEGGPDPYMARAIVEIEAEAAQKHLQQYVAQVLATESDARAGAAPQDSADLDAGFIEGYKRGRDEAEASAGAAPLDVETLGFSDLLDIGEAILRRYPPNTIVCSHALSADTGARTVQGIADLIEYARLAEETDR